MPVRKFRSLEEWQVWKQTAPALPSDDLTFRTVQERLAAFVPYGGPRGVRKYRSIEEANADRERWERERANRVRAERLRKP
jgi:hypothetical protein